MEINNKKKECIFFPQLTCIFCFCIYIVLAIIYRNYPSYKALFIPPIIFAVCFYFINTGIIDKNFKNFNTGLKLSLIFAISCFIFKFVSYFFIIIIFVLAGNDNDDLYKKSSDSIICIFFNKLTFVMFITSVIDFFLATILCCFKNKVKKFCENQNYNQNESTNAPLYE